MEKVDVKFFCQSFWLGYQSALKYYLLFFNCWMIILVYFSWDLTITDVTGTEVHDIYTVIIF